MPKTSGNMNRQRSSRLGKCQFFFFGSTSALREIVVVDLLDYTEIRFVRGDEFAKEKLAEGRNLAAMVIDTHR